MESMKRSMWEGWNARALVRELMAVEYSTMLLVAWGKNRLVLIKSSPEWVLIIHEVAKGPRFPLLPPYVNMIKC